MQCWFCELCSELRVFQNTMSHSDTKGSWRIIEVRTKNSNFSEQVQNRHTTEILKIIIKMKTHHISRVLREVDENCAVLSY
jgi:hypothetical protein